MNSKKYLENYFRGWLPKEPNIAYARKSSTPRWRKPRWIALTLVGVIVLSSIAFVGAQTYLRYSNPQADITSGYYEKTLNCSTASIGDTVEVSVQVYWHGYVMPEFKRDVKIVDPYSSFFTLANQTNIYDSKGYGGSYQLTYTLKVVGGEGVSTKLPEPRLYLDTIEIPVDGTSPTLSVTSK